MEAEYMALSDAIRELLARIYVIHELGIPIIKPTIVYSDNQATIATAHKEGDYRRVKHINIKYHFIRHHIEEETLLLIYILSKNQLVDFLTKPLSPGCHSMSVHSLCLD
jgi:hypothetical protein